MKRMARSSATRITRRDWLSTAAAVAGAGMVLGGCSGRAERPAGELEAVWGKRGLAPGKLNKPRAITIDKDDLR